MKKMLLAVAFAASVNAMADTKQVLAGSDTLAGAISDAIIQSGMDKQLQYAGGGSGTGEKNLVNGDQGIAPMSREFNPALAQQLTAKGINVVDHVLALDGISMFVKSNSPIKALDLPTVTRIYTCEFTKWEQVPGSNMSGPIRAFRRNDASGTTDAFKHFTGLKAFGPCVQVLQETADISDVTSRDVNAIGYSGLSGKVAGNRAAAIAAKPGSPAVLPTTATIRNFSYPMARKLYVYEATGARPANKVEKQFLQAITDRSFMDPIMQAHEFITLD